MNDEEIAARLVAHAGNSAYDKRRLSSLDTWPDLRVTVHLLPWAWQLRPRFYADDVEGARGLCSFHWLFLEVEWMANRPMFTEAAHDADAFGTPHA